MRALVFAGLALMAGCAQIQETAGNLFGGGDGAATESAAPETVAEAEPADEATEPVAGPGWTGARQTVAALGDPTRAGLWLETPLVSEQRNGRVVVRRTGASAYVALIPVSGSETAGSRLSLSAMRALLAPIDELVELDVYAN